MTDGADRLAGLEEHAHGQALRRRQGPRPSLLNSHGVASGMRLEAGRADPTAVPVHRAAVYRARQAANDAEQGACQATLAGPPAAAVRRRRFTSSGATSSG